MDSNPSSDPFRFLRAISKSVQGVGSGKLSSQLDDAIAMAEATVEDQRQDLLSKIPPVDAEMPADIQKPFQRLEQAIEDVHTYGDAAEQIDELRDALREAKEGIYTQLPRHIQEVIEERGLVEAPTHNAARCLVCQDVLVSLHRHDFIRCTCGNLAVDGGFNYCKRLYRDGKDSYENLSYQEALTFAFRAREESEE